jgi:hypothetical protein
MRKYDRTSIKNSIDKNIDKNGHSKRNKKFRWPDFVAPKIRNECYRIAKLTKRFQEIYNENLKLFTEKHIVLQVFLSTCSMASCTEPRPDGEPWILNDIERFILNFVKDHYLLDWCKHLNEGKGVQYWYPPVLGPTTVRLNPVVDDGSI